MPRGKKKLTLEEQLKKITTEIENTENALKEMKNTKKELEEQIKINRLSEIDELMVENNLTFDDLKALLITN